MKTITDLPIEVLTLAIDYTNPTTPFELNRYAAVNRAFHTASSNCTAWRRLAPPSPIPASASARQQRPSELAAAFRTRDICASKAARKGLRRLWDKDVQLQDLMALVQRYPEHWDIVYRAVQCEYGAAHHFYKTFLAENPWSEQRFVRWGGNAFRAACDAFRADPHLTLMAIESEPAALAWAAPTLRCNDRFVRMASTHTKFGSLDIDVSPNWRRDPEHALNILHRDPRALLYLDNTLKLNKDFLIEAITHIPGRIMSSRHGDIPDPAHPPVLEFVDTRLRANPTFMFRVGRHSECAGLFLDERLKADRHFIRNWVQQHIPSPILFYADPKYQKDKTFVRELALIDHRVFWDADVCLHQDKQLVRELVGHNPQVFQFIHRHFQQDKDFLGELIRKDPRVLSYAGNDINLNRRFVAELAFENPRILQYAHRILREDSEFMTSQGQHHFCAFAFASQKLRSHSDFMLTAIQTDARSFLFASPELKRQKDFLHQARIAEPKINNLKSFQTALRNQEGLI